MSKLLDRMLDAGGSFQISGVGLGVLRRDCPLSGPFALADPAFGVRSLRTLDMLGRPNSSSSSSTSASSSSSSSTSSLEIHFFDIGARLVDESCRCGESLRPPLGGGVGDPGVDVVGGVLGRELEPRELVSDQPALSSKGPGSVFYRESSLRRSACE